MWTLVRNKQPLNSAAFTEAQTQNRTCGAVRSSPEKVPSVFSLQVYLKLQQIIYNQTPSHVGEPWHLKIITPKALRFFIPFCSIAPHFHLHPPKNQAFTLLPVNSCRRSALSAAFDATTCETVTTCNKHSCIVGISRQAEWSTVCESAVKVKPVRSHVSSFKWGSVTRAYGMPHKEQPCLMPLCDWFAKSSYLQQYSSI